MLSKSQKKQQEEVLNKIPIFLAKTFRIIDNPDYFPIISWTDDQKSFVIKDISRLTDQIFLRHFKHTNFASFVRQLNMYGFRKIRCDEEEGPVFHHEYFQKKHTELLLLMKRKDVGNNEKVAEGAIVPVGERQERLQREVQLLKAQHEQLQNMMEVLMEQNKAITAQNKAFANMMRQMKEKYRKKLQTLMLLFLFGKKAKAEDGDFLFPPQLEHMLSAFEQMNNGGNPLIFYPQQKRKRQSLKMITGEPQFLSDVDRSEMGSQLDRNQKEDLFGELRDMKSEDKQQEDKNNPLENQILAEEDKLELEPLPPSPLSSIISRPGRLRKNECEWDDYLDRMNHSDYSEWEQANSISKNDI